MSKYNSKNFQQKSMKVPELKSQETFRVKQKDVIMRIDKKLLAKTRNKFIEKYMRDHEEKSRR